MVAIEHRTVSVGEVDVHLAEAGAGPPLLLLHGSRSTPRCGCAWSRCSPTTIAC
jgi:pimeloyl-ACP methyl ester carboxylesterase